MSVGFAPVVSDFFLSNKRSGRVGFGPIFCGPRSGKTDQHDSRHDALFAIKKRTIVNANEPRSRDAAMFYTGPNPIAELFLPRAIRLV